MNFAELITEVEDRGFSSASATRRKRWINRAYQRICAREAWGFLETTATGNSPLTIADIRAVLQVIDTTNKTIITWEDPRDIRAADPGLEQTGPPNSWYLSGTAVTTWPITTTALAVRYLKTPADLALSTDTPLVPARFHHVIVDGAVCEALKDTGDYNNVAACEAIFERGIEEMRNELLVEHFDVGASLHITDSSTDW